MEEQSFNLIDEKWIPIANYGRVSLKDIFSNFELSALGGNPIQKIALMKLFLAIAQAAKTPKDNQEWKSLDAQTLGASCLEYLEKWHDCFNLYGEKPFLQMPAIKAAKIQSFGAVQPAIASGNTTLLNQTQIEAELSNADKALLLVELCGFAFGGKKTDNSIILSDGYTGKLNDKGKASSGRFGPSIGYIGYLHSFLFAQNIIETILINLFTQKDIEEMKIFEKGLGTPPWENMPKGEDDEIAKDLKQSLMGRLIPLCRFCLLAENGIHYSEGIAHLGHKDRFADPSISVNYSGKDIKALWVDAQKRPWRELTSLLSFLSTKASSKFECPQLKLNIERIKGKIDNISIWSGGLAVSSNAGEQYVSGSDDYVDSVISINIEDIGEIWFEHLQSEMEALKAIEKNIYASTLGYFKALKVDGAALAAKATNLFWQLCEKKFQELIYACDDADKVHSLRPIFTRFAQETYDANCPKDTARQMEAWAENKPNFSKYLKPLSNKEAA